MRIGVNGIDLKVNINGDGKPLLLLHGFTGSSRNWDSFIPAWSKKCKIIAVDIIGHGESDAPHDASRYSMVHAAQDLASLLDRLGIKEASVLGYSMGGRLALSFAHLYPSRVHALLLESASPGLATSEEREARVKQDEALAASIVREGLEWFVRHWENIPLFSSVKKLPDAVQDELREQRLCNRTLGLANSLKGMGTGVQPSWWNDLHGLQMPVLLMAGTEDKKFAGIAQKMASLLPHSTLCIIPDAGHMIHVEQREIFDTIVMNYLSSI